MQFILIDQAAANLVRNVGRVRREYILECELKLWVERERPWTRLEANHAVADSGAILVGEGHEYINSLGFKIDPG